MLCYPSAQIATIDVDLLGGHDSVTVNAGSAFSSPINPQFSRHQRPAQPSTLPWQNPVHSVAHHHRQLAPRSHHARWSSLHRPTPSPSFAISNRRPRPHRRLDSGETWNGAGGIMSSVAALDVQDLAWAMPRTASGQYLGSYSTSAAKPLERPPS